MRKILLATSALVAGSVAASAANAAAPEVTLFGSLDIQYQTESYDDQGATANTDQLGYLNFMNSFMWDINAEADNGLAYGGRVDWRPSNDTIDEIWIDLKGSFGTVVLGNDDAVGDNNVPHGGSVLVGSFGFTGTYVAGTSANVGNASTGAESTSRNYDASKVSYYSPDLGGFGAGVSYTPNASSAGTSTTSANLTTGAVSTTTADSTYGSQVELAAWWSGDLGGASLTAGALYKTADANVATNEDLDAYEIGATVGVAGFTFGAGIFDNGDSGVAKTATSANAGNGMTLGVSYSMGATAVSLGYLATEIDNSDNTSDEYTNISLDVEHTVAEGLLVYGGVQFAESNDGSVSGTAGTQESTSIVVGTRLSF